jgi:hypothetical protein
MVITLSKSSHEHTAQEPSFANSQPLIFHLGSSPLASSLLTNTNIEGLLRPRSN